MDRSSQVIAPKRKGWLLTVREPPDASPVSRVRVPLAKPRICGATCPSDHPVVQLRENAQVQPGKCGFITIRDSEQLLWGNHLVRLGKPIPIGSVSLDGPWSLGYRLSEKSRAGSNPAPAAMWLGSHLHSCPSALGGGPLDFDYRTGSSTASEHPLARDDTGSRPVRNIEVNSCPPIGPRVLRRVAGLGYRL